jgi:hypothetical protein
LARPGVCSLMACTFVIWEGRLPASSPKSDTALRGGEIVKKVSRIFIILSAADNSGK